MQGCTYEWYALCSRLLFELEVHQENTQTATRPRTHTSQPCIMLMLQRTCPLCHEQSKGIDAWNPIRSICPTLPSTLLIDHHALREEALAIRHAFENDLSPDADSEFLSFLFQNL